MSVNATDRMNQPQAPTTPKPPLSGGTRIQFDLEKELRPEELEKFIQAAEQAGAPTLTDHFLNLTIRMTEEGRAA